MGTKVTRTFDILERYMKKFPRKDALGGKKSGEWYTYSTEEYNEKSHQFALGIMAMGFKKGDKIATVTPNCPEWNFADMGMSMTGVVHVPIYPTIGEDEYKYILKHAEVKMIIVGDAKLFKKIQPLVNLIDGLDLLYSFDEVEGAKNFKEIMELGESKKAELEGELERLLQEGISLKEASQILGQKYGLSTKALYQLGLKKKGKNRRP